MVRRSSRKVHARFSPRLCRSCMTEKVGSPLSSSSRKGSPRLLFLEVTVARKPVPVHLRRTEKRKSCFISQLDSGSLGFLLALTGVAGGNRYTDLRWP